MADDRTKAQDPLAERARQLEELRSTEHELAFSGDQREETGELSVVDQHPADVADFTFQRELEATTEQILDREAQQVEDAMRQRERGEYGVCSNCGRAISKERLQARPQATLCIDCQQQLEASRPAGA